ncbi:MAG: GGDEF domain-containing protein [Arenimonas sp.]
MAIEAVTDRAFASELELEQHVRTERIRFVLIQSTLPIAFSPLAGFVLSMALWRAVADATLVAFVAGLLVIAVQRVVVTRRFPDPPPTGARLLRWERIYIGSIMLVDLWWGVGALFLLVPGATTENAIVFCFVMMMAGGHTASYSAHGPTVVLGVLALTVPITVAFAVQPDTFHWTLAFVSLMFVAASFRSVGTLRYFFGRTYRLAHELNLARGKAERLARIDMLSGLHNRRSFYETGAAALAEASTARVPLALLMIDIDHFKSINDRCGHAGGDAAIRDIAARILELAPPGSTSGRLGGEEFAVLLPGADPEESAGLGEALVVHSAGSVLDFQAQRIAYTISVGIAHALPGEDFDAFVARADAALYRAKGEGRNRVVVA